ncbi:helix-turn-helix domain-containing protein [Legionella bozemanae]|uniref:helix-turn-helix domain-containing protein n=1 Tax=Legionella bozemanae TaxID=447 RepID=UPI001041333E|nr:helix-turn-helix domain-containing protein [Legionella bozemanae]
MAQTINRPAEKRDNPTSNKYLHGNSASSQRTRILKHFETCPRLSTLQARNEYGILHPGGRMMELKRKGYHIETHWINEPDTNGVLHRIGLYIYLGKQEVSHE